ncbi:hypothetical protein QJS04_geneDACA023164 [Acorus gramineus]|uniref:Uncharacterized protein n=1 Tax=Acorus gramineus TaxID=55184 RepID=A0AAV9BW59_ACOGR|nr:hypothetical protein QJS04_geneDACA023164 [Acorus gramineus]
MPPFTAAAFDSILESSSPSRDPPSVAPKAKTESRKIHRPSLYTTPDVTPLPDIPSSHSPSPYIVKHKRRGPRLLNSFSHGDVDRGPAKVVNGFLHESINEACAGDPVDGAIGGFTGESEAEANGLLEEKNQNDRLIEAVDVVSPIFILPDHDGDLFDHQDTMSIMSNPEKATTPMGEYFDAFEEENVGQSETDPAEELCQQVVVSRAVANSVGRGSSRAEVELERESEIEAKNFEISRLWDRLRYYELVNQEMSQRNQEVVERARRRRHRRKRMQKWIWGSIGIAIALGVGALTWPYLPTVTFNSDHNGDEDAVVDFEHDQR